MATVFATQPQQQLTSQQAAPNTNDPLFQALVKHITTGPGAQNVTLNEVQGLIDTAIAQPNGRAYLENLTAPSDTISGAVWQRFANGFGTIAISKMDAKISLNFPDIVRNLTATINFPLFPYNGPLSGRLYFNDASNLVAGANIIVYVWVDGLTLNMSISINQQPIAIFVSDPIGFYFPPNRIPGSGTLS